MVTSGRSTGSTNSKNLVVFAYAFDPEDMVFSHQYRAILELTKHFDKVTVIANTVDKNIISSEKLKVWNLRWDKYPFPINALRLYFFFITTLFSINNLSSTVVFSFMTESHAALIGPITKVLGIRHILWYAHTSLPLRLHLARMMVDRVVTSTKASVSFTDKKTVYIGQMVEEGMFLTKEERNYSLSTNWIHIGRIDPSKNIDFIIQSFLKYQCTQPQSRLTLIGKSTIGFQDYENSLKVKYARQIAKRQIIFAGKKTQKEISLNLSISHLFVHAFTGSLDKTLIEAAFSAIPIVTCNTGFLSEFGSFYADWRHCGEFEVLFECELDSWLNSTSLERESLAQSRRRLAKERHSFNHWISNLLEQLLE